MLTIAQITDLHVTTAKDPVNGPRNAERLRLVLASIRQLKPQPAAIMISGDLVDRGQAEEYAILQDLLRHVDIPVYYGLGNHDRRDVFLKAFEGRGIRVDENGFVQYAVDFGALRMVVCDTLEEGSEGGGFCDRRAAWLAATLDEAPDKPTFIALHHPPILSGIQWMDPEPDEPWIERLADVIRDRPQVRALVAGHLHRAFSGVLAGRLVVAAPATSIQLTLNLTAVDMKKPDGREILVEEPPGYALVMLERGQVTTHICVAGDYSPAVAYTVPFRK